MTISFNVMKWILPIVFGSGIAYALLKDLPGKQEANTMSIAAHDKEIGSNEKRISLVEKDITYIRSGIDDIIAAMSRGRNRRYERDHRRDRSGSGVTP